VTKSIKSASACIVLAAAAALWQASGALANQEPGNNLSAPASDSTNTTEHLIEPKAELKAKALKLFSDYKQKDQSSDPSLINLYATDAVIYSGIERERGGVLYDKLDRATFASQMASAIKDPHIKELNQSTVYHEPKINHINREGEKVALQMSFKAQRAKSGIKVHWLVRENKDGALEIYDEHTVSYKLKSKK
jgi:hypothetical protein